MNTILQSNELPLDGDDRLMDALLREHARAGDHADASFLKRLNEMLEMETEALAVSHATRKRPRPVVWTLGIAAGILLVIGLFWKNPLNHDLARNEYAVQSTSLRNGLPLITGIPPELIEGTPQPMNVPSLIGVPASAPTLLVPDGTALLSRGKPVTSSDQDPIIGSLDLITDGEKDAGEGYFVELLDGLQWVQIDLGKSAAIHAVWVWHFHSQRRAYHDVIIRISDDPEFKTGVATIFNNDYDDSAKMGRGSDNPYVESRFGLLADAKGKRGRYVRLYSNGNTANAMNHYIEVEVFGIPE